MTLSLNKLENLLHANGFLPKKFFVIDNLIIYIEVLSINNADSFMLYIPSKYDIQIGQKDNVYNIKNIQVDEYGNIPIDYAGDPDNIELEKAYDEIDLLKDPLELSSKDNEYEDNLDMFEELSFLSRSSKDKDEITYYINILILGSGIITFVILNYFS